MIMRILLDTHVLLWSLFDPERLPKKAKEKISNLQNEIFISAASLWEIEIKHCKRPDSMPYSSQDIAKAVGWAGYRVLPIEQKHIQSLAPIVAQDIHSDPFDHMILAVAVSEQFVLFTHDENIMRYQNVMLESC